MQLRNPCLELGFSRRHHRRRTRGCKPGVQRAAESRKPLGTAECCTDGTECTAISLSTWSTPVNDGACVAPGALDARGFDTNAPGLHMPPDQDRSIAGTCFEANEGLALHMTAGYKAWLARAHGNAQLCSPRWARLMDSLAADNDSCRSMLSTRCSLTRWEPTSSSP